LKGWDMIEQYLVDRDECIHNGHRCCFEIITVKCPDCGDDTNVVVTFPDYSEYHHDNNRVCRVFFTEEMTMNRDKFDERLLVLPGYMRE